MRRSSLRSELCSTTGAEAGRSSKSVMGSRKQDVRDKENSRDSCLQLVYNF